MFLLIFEPDTKSTEHKHTLSAQHRLIIGIYYYYAQNVL